MTGHTTLETVREYGAQAGAHYDSLTFREFLEAGYLWDATARWNLDTLCTFSPLNIPTSRLTETQWDEINERIDEFERGWHTARRDEVPPHLQTIPEPTSRPRSYEFFSSTAQ